MRHRSPLNSGSVNRMKTLEVDEAAEVVARRGRKHGDCGITGGARAAMKECLAMLSRLQHRDEYRG